MNILYLTLTRFNNAPYRDASTRYRCFHFAEDLRAAGHQADIVSIDSLELEQLRYYDVLCVLRPTKSKRLLDVLDVCQCLGVLTLADFDDLIFSPELAEQAPAVLSQQAAVQPMRQKFQQHLEALRQFSHVTVATQSLEEQVKRLHPSAAVQRIPNGLSRYWIESNRYLDDVAVSRSPTITYLPGSRSHNADFRSIAEVLSDVLASHPDVTLNIIGELDFDTCAFKPSQLQKTSWIDYARLPSITRNSLMTIAPLKASEFNQCKSHIKFIESAAFGTPAIMSAIPDVERHPSVNGLYVVNSALEWKNALNHVIETYQLSSHHEALQQYARSRCMNHNSLGKLLAFLEPGNSRETHVRTTSYASAS